MDTFDYKRDRKFIRLCITCLLFGLVVGLFTGHCTAQTVDTLRSKEITIGKGRKAINGTQYTKIAPYSPVITERDKSTRTWKSPLISDNDGLVYLFAFHSGLWDGFHDALIYHYRAVERVLSTSNWFRFNPQFWRDSLSWKNKWKDWDNGDRRERFPGSSTIFVAGTDGPHLTKFFDNTSMVLSVALSAGDIKSYPKKQRKWVILKKFVMVSISKSIGRAITYYLVFGD